MGFPAGRKTSQEAIAAILMGDDGDERTDQRVGEEGDFTGHGDQLDVGEGQEG